MASPSSGHSNVLRPKTEKRRRGRPTRNAQPLSRKKVLKGSLALLDKKGLTALSMRKLALAMGVTPMALYNHFASKDELLDAVHEAVLLDAPLPRIGAKTPWKQAATEIARTLRCRLRAHPHALLLFATRPVRTEAILKVVDNFLGQLLAAGFSACLALYAFDGIVVFTVGHALAEFGISPVAAPERDGSDLRSRQEALTRAGLIHLPRVLAATLPHNYDTEFESGLRALLDGFDLQRRSR